MWYAQAILSPTNNLVILYQHDVSTAGDYDAEEKIIQQISGIRKWVYERLNTRKGGEHVNFSGFYVHIWVEEIIIIFYWLPTAKE